MRAHGSFGIGRCQHHTGPRGIILFFRHRHLESNTGLFHILPIEFTMSIMCDLATINTGTAALSNGHHRIGCGTTRRQFNLVVRQIVQYCRLTFRVHQRHAAAFQILFRDKFVGHKRQHIDHRIADTKYIKLLVHHVSCHQKGIGVVLWPQHSRG